MCIEPRKMCGFDFFTARKYVDERKEHRENNSDEFALDN